MVVNYRMLKILERGKKKLPINVYQIKCNTCGCKFLYEREDIIYLCDDSRYIKCPQCSYAVWILFKRRYKGKLNLVEKVEDK